MTKTPVHRHGGAAIDLEQPGLSCRPPVIFEPPGVLTGGELELWVATSAPEWGWGGTTLFYSEDDDDYYSVGVVTGGITWGRLQVPILPAPLSVTGRDDVTVLDLALYDGASLASATPEALRRHQTLCYVGEGNAYELLAFQSALLYGKAEGGLLYQVSGLLRGLHGTGRSRDPDGAVQDAVMGHAAGAGFVRLDRRNPLLKVPYEKRLVGHRVWFKLVSCNAYGEAPEPLTGAEPIPFVLEGLGGR